MPIMSTEEKIAQLLKKAEGVGAEEAKALTEAAEAMMLRYGIERTAIEAARLGKDRTAEKIVQGSIFFSGSYARALIGMGTAVVQALGEMSAFYTRNVYNRDSDGKLVKGEELQIVGYERDVEQAKVLIASLQLQAVVAMQEFVKEHYLWSYMDGTQKFNEKRGFLVGFGQGAASRIRRNKRTIVSEQESKSPGTALALVNRGREVEKYMENIKLGKGRGMKISGSGQSAGYGAGRNANTGDSAVRGSHNALKG